jgi:tetratricopeptide (TPR) repeat protein
MALVSGTDTQLSALLSGARDDLSRGDEAAAQALLQQALLLRPDNPLANFLSGVAEFQQGDWAAAEPWFRRALALSPGQVPAYLHLAQTLRALGRADEAIAVCRAGLVVAPGTAQLALELATAQEHSGELAAAEAGYKGLLAQAPGMTQAALQLGDLLMRSKRASNAEPILRRALQGSEGRGLDAVERAVLEHQLGWSLKLQRRYGDALSHLDRAAALGPNNPQVQGSRAVVLQHLRRFDEAMAAYERVLAATPLDMEAHLQFNELLYRQGRDQEFLRSYDVAAARAPDSVLPFNAKGNLLLKSGRANEAQDAFRLALRIAPDNAAALTGQARALEALADSEGALACHDKVVKLHPEDVDALVASAGFLLRKHQGGRALERAARAHALRPDDQSALTLLGMCYRVLDDERERALNDYGSLVQIFDLDAPTGYANMQHFNRDLDRYLEAMHGDAREHFSQTLRGGTRLYDEIFANGHELVDALQRQIERAVSSYIAGLRQDGSHPFTSRRSAAFSYSGSWSSRIRGSGFHVNHIHPAGWISSAYYVAVPDVARDTSAKPGWLKFGEPSEDFGAAFTPRRSIQPRPGRLVLFPSYMWHGTVPCHSPQNRTTIAFDVVPRSS